MKKFLPWVGAVLLVAALAVVVWVAPSRAQDVPPVPQGPSVCLQWATVTPVAPCNCAPTATPIIATATATRKPPIQPNDP